MKRKEPEPDPPQDGGWQPLATSRPKRTKIRDSSAIATSSHSSSSRDRNQSKHFSQVHFDSPFPPGTTAASHIGPQISSRLPPTQIDPQAMPIPKTNTFNNFAVLSPEFVATWRAAAAFFPRRIVFRNFIPSNYRWHLPCMPLHSPINFLQ